VKYADSIAAIVVVAVAIGGATYWFGIRENAPAVATSNAANSAPGARKVLYYRNPMGQPDTSPVPKKDSMGMDYIPVFADEPVAKALPAAPAPATENKGQILYYRNPMGQPDTSPVPKKDSMGMDYIPVYAGNAPDSGIVAISPARLQMLGVQSVPVERRSLARTIRTLGTIAADERRLSVVNTKFEGWIEKLDVSAVGDTVVRGAPLMEVYAPELVVAEQEYLLAYRAQSNLSAAGEQARSGARQLMAAALQRLRNWDISDDQIQQLVNSGTVTRTLTVRAPASGIVLEKPAVQGMHFMPGEALYRIADLSSVWLMADVFEQDLGAVRPGQTVTIGVNAYPGSIFTGKVDFIYPTVAEATRTGKVRIIAANTDGRLKPGMYANVELRSALNAQPVLVIPDSAIIDSGAEQGVLIDRGQGRFEPRPVKLGARGDGYAEVREGLGIDDRVVVSANFLIDAESNLRAALKTFAPPQPTESQNAQPPK